MDMSEAALHLYELFAKSRLGPDEVQPHDVERTVELIVHQAQKHAEKKVLEHAMSKEDGLQIKAEIAALRADTKAEIAALRADTKVKFEAVKGTLNLHNWMLGLIIAGVLALVMKAFFNV